MKLLVYHLRSETYRALLRERFPDLDVVAVVPGADDAALERHLPEAEVLVGWRIPVAELARARRLRWIQLTSAGAEHVLDAGPDLGDVVLTNARGIHGELMADYAIGVIVMLQWGFPRLMRLQQARTWRHQYTEPLAGKCLGILGVGAIGGEIARRGAAMGMRVLGMRREPRPADGVARMFGPDGLGEMLPQCDFVVVVVPATPETRRMLGERELRAMRRGAYLINVARGSVVDEAALARALADGWLGGAALDVFETEPLPPESPLWAMDNVIVTAHIAGEPDEYPKRVMGVVGENIVRWREGRPLLNVIDPRRGY